MKITSKSSVIGALIAVLSLAVSLGLLRRRRQLISPHPRSRSFLTHINPISQRKITSYSMRPSRHWLLPPACASLVTFSAPRTPRSLKFLCPCSELRQLLTISPEKWGSTLARKVPCQKSRLCAEGCLHPGQVNLLLEELTSSPPSRANKSPLFRQPS